MSETKINLSVTSAGNNYLYFESTRVQKIWISETEVLRLFQELIKKYFK